MIKAYYYPNGTVFYAHESIEKDLPYIEVETTEFLKPMINLETLELYEGATEEEINKPILLDELTPRQFWINVFKAYGITQEQVVEVVKGLPISDAEKTIYLITINKSQVFERLDPLFDLLIPIISQSLNLNINIDKIF
jgi:hypothetical protein